MILDAVHSMVLAISRSPDGAIIRGRRTVELIGDMQESASATTESEIYIDGGFP